MKKFGYPKTLLKEYDNWVVVVRPVQITAGSLVLICKEDAIAFSQISESAFQELSFVIRELEDNLTQALSYCKINYLMLMMVDKEVHYHIIPRYETVKEVIGIEFEDNGWPGLPNFAESTELTDVEFNKLVEFLGNYWITNEF